MTDIFLIHPGEIEEGQSEMLAAFEHKEVYC